MTSFRDEIAKRVIDPQALIKAAEARADDADKLLREKTSSSKETPFSLNEEDSIAKQASNLIDGIDNYLKNGIEEKPAVKVEKPVVKTAEKSEKSAAAKVVQLGIENDLTKSILEKTSEEVIQPEAFDNIDFNELNEKVAAKAGKVFNVAKKILIGGAAGGTLAGGGYVAGKLKGKQTLKDYMAADAQRDRANIGRAYQYGQRMAHQQLMGGATNG